MKVLQSDETSSSFTMHALGRIIAACFELTRSTRAPARRSTETLVSSTVDWRRAEEEAISIFVHVNQRVDYCF